MKGPLETTCLPLQGRDKICVYSTLPRTNLWDIIGYIIVVILFKSWILSGFTHRMVEGQHLQTKKKLPFFSNRMKDQ